MTFHENENVTIKTVGVAGSGTMGAGIAIVAARAGFRTIVYDHAQDALDRARKQTEGFFAKSVERKKLTQPEVDAIMSSFSGSTDIAALATCDIVIEAVFEDLKVKHALLADAQQGVSAARRFSRRTLRRFRSRKSRQARGATSASSACISACPRS